MSNNDIYSFNHPGLNGPMIGSLGVITPSDSDNLRQCTREVMADGAGNISVVWWDGLTTVEAVAAGVRYPWRIRRVNATGTTATGIRGYY